MQKYSEFGFNQNGFAEKDAEKDANQIVIPDDEQIAVYTAAEARRYVDPDDDGWIVRGLLQRGKITTVFGHGGKGKTFLVLDLLRAIASDEMEFLSFPIECRTPDMWTPTVVFLDFETGEECPRSIFRRLIKMEADNLSNLLIIPGVKFMTPYGVDYDKLTAVLELHNPLVVAIDSFSAIHRGDTNANDRVWDTLQKLQRVIQAVNAAGIVIDHTSKYDARENSDDAMPLGSVAKYNFTRLAVLLRELEDVELPYGYLELVLAKANELEPQQLWQSLTIRRTTDPIRHVIAPHVGIDAAIREIREANPNAKAQDVLEMLRERGVKISESTYYRRLRKMRQTGDSKRG